MMTGGNRCSRAAGARSGHTVSYALRASAGVMLVDPRSSRPRGQLADPVVGDAVAAEIGVAHDGALLQGGGQPARE
jgi:hypothetical protein